MAAMMVRQRSNSTTNIFKAQLASCNLTFGQEVMITFVVLFLMIIIAALKENIKEIGKKSL